MNVRVFRVVVDGRNPVERSSQIPLHPRQEIASQLLQVGSVAELGRHDQLPQAFVASLLPTLKPLSDVIDSLVPSKPTAFASRSCVALSRAM